MPYLKKKYSSGYYTQIQIASGLARAEGCDFIVYLYNGLIFVRVKFDETYFCSVLKKLSSFYKDHLMPYYASSWIHLFTVILCHFLNNIIIIVFYLGFSDANKFNLGKKLYCSLTEHFCYEIPQLLKKRTNIFHQILPSFMECCKVLML